jgi:hypothetical protein
MPLAVVSLGLVGCGSGSSTPSPSAPSAPPDGATPATAAPTGAAANDPAAIGRAFVDALASGDTAAAEAVEDATMRAAAPAAGLAQLWQQIVAQAGAFQGLGAVTTSEQAPYTIAIIQGNFAAASAPLLVTVNGDGRVAGLHLGAPVPAGSPTASASPSASASPASYVLPGTFSETDITVGSTPWALPGTLTMPTGAGPFPAVVLIAGWGPQDRDETIGPNKPLRDLA